MPRGNGSYVIPETASLEEVLEYTHSYVTNSLFPENPYYRYNRYREVVDKALDEVDSTIRFNPLGSPGNKIICLDLGCGPGLFSWVVHDYLATKRWRRQNAEYIGYDHAENMIKLARLFRKYLSVETYTFDGYSEIDKMLKEMRERDFSDHNCIVTLGHVLIQANNREALENFARAIKGLHPWNSCILVAVDAKSKLKPVFFRALWDLLEVLELEGVNVRSGNEGSAENAAYYAVLD